MTYMTYMNFWDRKLLREQVDMKLQSLKRSAADAAWSGRWIKMMRQTLGMTATQLARRAGIDQSRMTRIEQGEENGTLKLETMQKMADALGMDFVYGFVPKISLEEQMQAQALVLAAKRLQPLSHTMALEDQMLMDAEAKKQLREMAERILVQQDQELWN